MSRCRQVLKAAFILSIAFASPGRPEVVLNEVLYDPEGPDAGYEFVEIYNTGSERVSLEGWALEAGNGSRPGQWQRRWLGGAVDAIDPGGFFVVGGDSLSGTDATARLRLQNGPDAVRLLSPLGVADLLGWGELIYGEYYEGTPATDVSAGTSLARRVDGLDTDSNAADFVCSPSPSPGMPNTVGPRLRVETLEADPPLVDPGHTFLLVLEAVNDGQEPLGASECRLLLRASGLTAGPAEPPPAFLAPGERGRWSWRVVASVVGVAWMEVFLDSGEEALARLPVRSGRGPVVVSEICYEPASEEGEWVEVLNVSEEPLDLRLWTLEDASGRRCRLAPEGFLLQPGAVAVVAEKAQALCAFFAGTEQFVVVPREGPWPRLNNSVNEDLGCSDIVLLRDSNGVPSDLVCYVAGDLDGSGVTLERAIEEGRLLDPDLLLPSPDPAGASPGRISQVPPSSHSRLAISPFPFRPGGADRLCCLRLSGLERSRATVEVYSLNGLRVRTLAAAAEVGPEMLAVWDGRREDGTLVAPGVYVFTVDLEPLGSGTPLKLRRALAVVR